MSCPLNSNPLDSNWERDHNLFNSNGFNAVIEQFPEWEGFTVKDYFNQYWTYIYAESIDEIDEKYFWLQFSDEYREEPEFFDPDDLTRRINSATHFLTHHMFEAFKTTPDQIGAFFKKMLFYTPIYTKPSPGCDLNFFHDQEIMILYYKASKLHLYHDYIRPHLYEMLKQFDKGTPVMKKAVIWILSEEENDKESCLLIEPYCRYPGDQEVRFTARVAVKSLLGLYPA